MDYIIPNFKIFLGRILNFLSAVYSKLIQTNVPKKAKAMMSEASKLLWSYSIISSHGISKPSNKYSSHLKNLLVFRNQRFLISTL